MADILWKGPPYPQIVKPLEGGFWTLGFDETNIENLVLDEELPVVTVDENSIRIDEDESALTSYRNNFLKQVSVNFNKRLDCKLNSRIDIQTLVICSLDLQMLICQRTTQLQIE